MPRPRKPREQRAYEGNPGHRPLPDSPRYAPLASEPPALLGAAGRELWQNIVGTLGKAGVLREPDYAALVALCVEWDRYIEAARDVSERGVLVSSSRNPGELVRNPSSMVANAALERWLRLASAFGLTPADRQKITAPDPADADNPLAEVLAMTRRDPPRSRRKAT